MENLTLGGRMKEYYENAYKIVLPWRMPLLLRLDGKSFHTLTRHTEKPFDHNIIESMDETACRLMSDIQGAELAYIQSDEISILLYPWKGQDSQPWFANELQKIVSISAGIASAMFSEHYGEFAVFDSRAFVLPEYEVVNYFLWRQIK
jgi:tRNA(His) guanylyltransferase